jgi:uncharacterized membrane protein YbhN (UPF0104 family)
LSGRRGGGKVVCYDRRMTPRRKVAFTWLALLIGVGLLIGAIIMASAQVDWSVLSDAQPWQLGVLAISVVGNLLASGMIWWVVTLSFSAKPKVQLPTMVALVCASGLLNYLPLRPGLVGRAAYLKMKHNLPVRQSMLILLTILTLSALVLGAAAAVAYWVPADWQYEVSLALLAVLTLALPAIAAKLLRRRIRAGWFWVPLRVADVLVTAVRLWVAFQVVGAPISYEQAVVAASAGAFVALLGPTPNGLGTREWTIGVITRASTGDVGFAAAVVDRGVEAIVVVVLGLWALKKVSLAKEGKSAT